MKANKINPSRFLALFAVVSVIAALLAACGAQPTPEIVEVEKVVTPAPEPAEPVTVVWWRSHGGEVGELLDKFAADFSALDNNITIQAEFQGGYDDHKAKIIAAAAANALPDMILIGDGHYPPMARNGIFLPLDDLINGPNGIDLTTFSEPIYRGVLDGRMYQPAYGVSTPILFTNKEALEAAGLEGAPDTWDEFFDVYLPRLAEANPDMVPFAYLAGAWWQQSAVWSTGAMVNDDNFEIDLANPAFVEWFERMQKAAEDGFVYVPTQADGGTGAFFGSGQAAMLIDSTGLIGSIDDISEGKFTAETWFLPAGPGGRWVPSGGNGLSIVRGVSPEVRDAAWEFIKYLQAPEQWGEYDKLTGYIPIQEDVIEYVADVIEADPRRQVAIDQFEFSRWHMKIVLLSRALQEMNDAFNEIVQTDVNVQDRLERLQETACQIAREEGFEPICAGE